MLARTTHPFVALPALVAAMALALLFAAPALGAQRVSFTAKRYGARTALFRVNGVYPRDIRRARVRVGRYRRNLRVRRVRRGAKKGQLRVWLPRRVLRRARRPQASRRRARARLTLTIKPEIVRPSRPANGPLASFETGNLSEFPNAFSTELGSLGVTGQRAYDGSRSARASFLGGVDTSFQRVWRQVNWGPGSDVWYGMALFIPDASAYCYWNPMRWDNYKTYGGSGDVGGLSIEGGELRLIQNRYGQVERQLINAGRVPQGRWFWVEVHQRLSGRDGQALSELFVDGRRVGSSTRANSAGRVVNHVRFGAVNVTSRCSRPSSVNFDRVSISDGMRGPLG